MCISGRPGMHVFNSKEGSGVLHNGTWPHPPHPPSPLLWGPRPAGKSTSLSRASSATPATQPPEQNLLHHNLHPTAQLGRLALSPGEHGQLGCSQFHCLQSPGPRCFRVRLLNLWSRDVIPSPAATLVLNSTAAICLCSRIHDYASAGTRSPMMPKP